MATPVFNTTGAKLSLVYEGSTQSIGTLKTTATAVDVLAVSNALNQFQAKPITGVHKVTTEDIITTV